MNIAIAIFWAVLALVMVCVTVAGHFGRLETEKTLRLAIDRGVALDGETIDRLKRAAGMPWAVRLIAFGIVVLFVGAGLAAFAVVLALSEPESLPPLMAIAAFVALVGLGLLATGAWLRRFWKDPAL